MTSALLHALESEMGTVCDLKCGCSATHIVIVHQFDHCHERNPRWDTTPKGLGERVFLMCPACAEWVMNRIMEYIQEMKSVVPEVVCMGCGKKVDWLSDLCRSSRLT